jgi:hypothetical protein
VLVTRARWPLGFTNPFRRPSLNSAELKGLLSASRKKRFQRRFPAYGRTAHRQWRDRRTRHRARAERALAQLHAPRNAPPPQPIAQLARRPCPPQSCEMCHFSQISNLVLLSALTHAMATCASPDRSSTSPRKSDRPTRQPRSPGCSAFVCFQARERGPGTSASTTPRRTGAPSACPALPPLPPPPRPAPPRPAPPRPAPPRPQPSPSCAPRATARATTCLPECS